MESPLLTKRVLVISAIVLLLLIFLYLYYYYYMKNIEPVAQTTAQPDTTLVAKQQAEHALFLRKQTFNSDIESMDGTLARIDTTLGNPNLSVEDRVKLLLESGYIKATVRTASDIDGAISGSATQFNEAIKLTTANPELPKQYAVSAKFGHLYNYVTNCFFRPAVKTIPAEYRPKGLSPYDANSVSIISEHQMASFKAMIDYAYTDPDLASSNDKSVISHRAYMASVYLASFSDTLEKSEEEELLQRIRDDQDKYQFATYGIFAKQGEAFEMRGELISEYHMTLVYDIEKSFGENVLTKEDNFLIDARHVAFRAQVRASESADTISLAAIGRVSDGYHISSIQRRHGDSERGRELLVNAVESFKFYTFASPESTDVMKGSYNYTLSSNGFWAKEKRRIFEVAQTNKELYDTFISAGVDIESYSNS